MQHFSLLKCHLLQCCCSRRNTAHTACDVRWALSLCFRFDLSIVFKCKRWSEDVQPKLDVHRLLRVRLLSGAMTPERITASDIYLDRGLMLS